MAIINELSNLGRDIS